MPPWPLLGARSQCSSSYKAPSPIRWRPHTSDLSLHLPEALSPNAITPGLGLQQTHLRGEGGGATQTTVALISSLLILQMIKTEAPRSHMPEPRAPSSEVAEEASKPASASLCPAACHSLCWECSPHGQLLLQLNGHLPDRALPIHGSHLLLLSYRHVAPFVFLHDPWNVLGSPPAHLSRCGRDAGEPGRQGSQWRQPQARDNNDLSQDAHTCRENQFAK